jgi:hypothetical protein
MGVNGALGGVDRFPDVISAADGLEVRGAELAERLPLEHKTGGLLLWMLIGILLHDSST